MTAIKGFNLLHKDKNIYFTMNKTEINLSQEKLNFIYGTYLEESQYWKKVALENVSAETERK